MKLPSLSSIIGWISTLLIGALTVFTGMMKFMPVPAGSPQEAMMQSMHITTTVAYTLGIVELVSAILFFVPRTSAIGFILLVGYYGGVLATLLTHGQDPMVGYIALLLLTISAACRNPELLSRLKRKV